jgi:tRNA pseudouridine38-40 synthase
MPRYKLEIEYNGAAYQGWQSQPQGLSVQNAIERAIFAFSGEKSGLIAAGRTDAGVHARGQVAHLDLARNWREDVVRDALNAYLRQAGDRIAILNAEIVPETFNARLSAIRRHYCYTILNRRAPPALGYGQVWQVARKLDCEKMSAAARLLIGHHDFTTYRAAECQAKSPMRTLERLDVMQLGDEIRIFASARSFLHHQIRSLAGSLELVGCGRWPVEEPRAALDAKDRTRCGPVAPPDGLVFWQVDYAEGDADKTSSP